MMTVWLSSVFTLGSALAVPGDRVENPALLGVVTAPAKKGVEVLFVLPDSPAAKAGIAVGDVLTKIDKTVLEDITDVDAALRSVAPGAEISVSLTHDKNKETISVTVMDRAEYKGEFLQRTARGAVGKPAAEWFAYAWANVPRGKSPPTLENSRGKVVVFHCFQSW